jgi:CO/xanthine dehydrogenase Mo-binding subunit
MVMSREEVFKASGPTSGGTVKVKMGVKKNGTITAAQAEITLQAGAFQGSPVQPACMCAFANYDLENVNVVGFDVVSNRPKVAAYRAPGGPISTYGVESVVDEIAEKLGMCPIELRLKNAAKEGTRAAYGPKFGPVGLIECLEAAKESDHWKAPLGPNQGRGLAAGFWFNIGGETTVSLQLNEDGTLTLMAGTPDIGGLRASLCMMAAEELKVDVSKIRPIIADTSSLGYNFLTGGSRATFSSGMATVDAARSIVKQACGRAAKLWDIPEEAVTFEDGMIRPAGENAGKHAPMSLGDIAKVAGKTGGAIVGYAAISAQGAAPSFGVHIADTEVDPGTGKVTVTRYTAIQDAGKAIHPSYVEGQYQGGAVQGIGWALNEEYIYGADGKLQNAGFLDYRVPVASDLPMIDTIIVEVPNPRHPYGVRGIGETPIVPPMAAIGASVRRASGVRFFELPMSPPKVLKAMKAAGKA